MAIAFFSIQARKVRHFLEFTIFDVLRAGMGGTIQNQHCLAALRKHNNAQSNRDTFEHREYKNFLIYSNIKPKRNVL